MHKLFAAGIIWVSSGSRRHGARSASGATQGSGGHGFWGHALACASLYPQLKIRRGRPPPVCSDDGGVQYEDAMVASCDCGRRPQLRRSAQCRRRNRALRACRCPESSQRGEVAVCIQQPCRLAPSCSESTMIEVDGSIPTEQLFELRGLPQERPLWVFDDH